jgi:pimeloyl-ACP methyl ester carboxylesterase
VLAHDLIGEGPDLVLLHQAIGDRHLWDDQWPWLTAEYRVLRPDHRGFGESPLTVEPFTRAGDVAELMEAVGMGPAIVVAGSMSGRVALELTVARPELVRGLVLIGPAVTGWTDRSAAMLAFAEGEEAALERGDLDEAVALNLRTWLDGEGRERAMVSDERRQALDAMVRDSLQQLLDLGADDGEEFLVADAHERLGEIDVPTVVLVGEHDVSDHRAIAAHLAKRIPGAELWVLPGVAHAPNFEDPEGFAPVLREALARIG